jgi:dihydrodipicolinate synthase/N-acetylneuraminate lyase
MKVVRRPRVRPLSIEEHLEVLRAACAAQAERAAAVTASAKQTVALSREARRRRSGASGVLTLVKRSA